MDWLADCARQITDVGCAVSWMTPLGLPIIQPYRASKMRTVTTVGSAIILAQQDDSRPVRATRQRMAFPPNYVHSLDSSHMYRTAIACKNKNLDFASVHDS